MPSVEEGIRQLRAKAILSPVEYYELKGTAKEQAFTISGNLATEAIDSARNKIAEALAAGTPREEVVEALKVLPLTEAHLEMVFRNAANEAYAQGMDHVLEDPMVEDAFPYRIRDAIHDQRARWEHKAMEKLGLDGTNVYYYKDPTWRRFRAPWGFNSIAPETLVDREVLVGFRQEYSGPMVRLKTLHGHVLTLTSNHPVATSSGFKPAGVLKAGDDALRDPFWLERTGRAFPSAYSVCECENHEPAAASKVFESLKNISGSFAIGRDLVSSNDFHGDAEFGYGDIEVVAVNRELLDDLKTSAAYRVSQGLFVFSDLAEPMLSSLGRSGELSFAVNTPGGRGPCQSRELDPSVVVHFPAKASSLLSSAYICFDDAQSIRHSFSTDSESFADRKDGLAACVTRSDFFGSDSETWTRNSLVETGFGENLSNDGPAYANDLTDRIKRLAFVPETDQIVDVEHFEFSGWVYDFTTPSNLIIAAGVLVSNCRCSDTPATIRQAARLGVKEAQRWLETGVEPEHIPVPRPPFDPDPAWERE